MEKDKDKKEISGAEAITWLLAKTWGPFAWAVLAILWFLYEIDYFDKQ